MKRLVPFLFLIGIGFFVGCTPGVFQPAQGTATSMIPSVTAATVTVTLTPVPPTPTQLIPAREGTLHFQPTSTITPDNADQITLLASYGSGFASQLVWSPDGSEIAAATSHGIALFSTADFQFKGLIPTSIMLRCLTYSPDGSLLAGGGVDGKITVWKTSDFQMMNTLDASDQAVVALAFSPDNSALAASTWDHTIQVWNTSTWHKMVTLQGHLSTPTILQFSQDGKILFSFSPLEQVKRWNLAKGKQEKELYIGKDSLGNAALAGAFAGDTAYFAAAQNNLVRIKDTKKDTTLLLLSDFPERVTAVAMNTDTSQIAVVTGSHLTVWNIENTRTSLVMEKEIEPAPDTISFSPDGSQLLLGSPVLEILSLETGEFTAMQGTTFTPGTMINQGILPTLNLLNRGFVKGTSQQVFLQDGISSAVSYSDLVWNSSATSLDGQWQAAGSIDGIVNLWKTEFPSQAVYSIQPDRVRSPITALTFDPLLQWLAVANSAGKLWIIELSSGAQITLPDPGLQIAELAVSPSGSRLAASGRGTIQLFQIDTAQGWAVVKTLYGYAPKFVDDDILAYRGYNEDGSPITALNLTTDEILFQLDAPGGEFIFSPDESLVAVSGKSLVFYRLPDGKKLAEFPASTPYAHVYFSEDGVLLYTVEWDGVLKVWGLKE
jgi:WD40 repeat protein